MSRKRPGRPGTGSANVACARNVRRADSPPSHGSPSERHFWPSSALRARVCKVTTYGGQQEQAESAHDCWRGIYSVLGLAMYRESSQSIQSS